VSDTFSSLNLNPYPSLEVELRPETISGLAPLEVCRVLSRLVEGDAPCPQGAGSGGGGAFCFCSFSQSQGNRFVMPCWEG